MIDLEQLRNSCPKNKNLRFKFKNGYILDGKIVMLGDVSAPSALPRTSNVAIIRTITGEKHRVEGTELLATEFITKSELPSVKYFTVFYDIFKEKRAILEDKFYHFSTKEDLQIEQILSSLRFILAKKGPLRDGAELELINITEISQDRYLAETKGRGR